MAGEERKVTVYPWDQDHIMKETKKAFLYNFDDYPPVQDWVPRSICRVDEKAGIVEIPDWKVTEIYKKAEEGSGN